MAAAASAGAKKCVGVISPSYGGLPYAADGSHDIAETVRGLGFTPVFSSLDGTLNHDGLDGLQPKAKKEAAWGTKREARCAVTAEEAARQIINLAQDPTIDYIWSASGGQGADEVADLLMEYQRDPKAYLAAHATDSITGAPLEYAAEAEQGFPSPDDDRALPAIVGFSDTTCIQLAMGEAGFPSYYTSPLDPGAGFLDFEKTLLHDETPTQTFSGLTPQTKAASDAERLEGHSTGALAHIVGMSLGKEWQFSASGENTVLCIEGGFGTEHLVSTLEEAKEGGALENVSGIVIGRSYNARPYSKELDAALKGLPEATYKDTLKAIQEAQNLPEGECARRLDDIARGLPVLEAAKATIRSQKPLSPAEQTLRADKLEDFGEWAKKPGNQARLEALEVPVLKTPFDTRSVAHAATCYQEHGGFFGHPLEKSTPADLHPGKGAIQREISDEERSALQGCRAMPIANHATLTLAKGDDGKTFTMTISGHPNRGRMQEHARGRAGASAPSQTHKEARSVAEPARVAGAKAEPEETGRGASGGSAAAESASPPAPSRIHKEAKDAAKPARDAGAHLAEPGAADHKPAARAPAVAADKGRG
jgi:muramoyltetrapeptide carboxypeptidase LdcA involved in peptidoglycan recycling